MQQNELASDVARCYGFQCQTRERCLRYLDRERQTYHHSTLFMYHMCEGEGLEHYMPAKEQK